MEPDNPLTSKETHGGGIGPVVGALIIVAVLVVAAVYFWEQHLNLLEEERSLQASQEAAFQAGTDSTLGTSTRISDIEKDLDDTIPNASTSTTATATTTHPLK